MSGIVLCAVDVSQPEPEAAVLQRASQLAQLDDARLDVITVVPDFGSSLVGGYFSPDFHDRAVAETRKRLTDYTASVLGAEAQPEIRHLVVTGSVYEEVLRIAKADEASLIVIGSHRPAFRDYLLGPNAARVVRHAHCSVFVVR